MTQPTRCVLDASALITFLLNREGAEAVAGCLGSSVMHAVTWTELLGALARRPDLGPADEIGARLKQSLTIDVGLPQDADQAGLLARLGPSAGLSLGDRYALAMASRLDLPVLTAHRHWAQLDLGGLRVRIHRVGA